MNRTCRLGFSRQIGFGLPELLVGVAIGLITTLVIMQVVTGFEGQKRVTRGNSDAHTNGAIALYTIQRYAKEAGYGLPIYTRTTSGINPMSCTPEPTVDHDDNGSTAELGISPLTIVDGGDTPGASDIVTIRFGDGISGGVPMRAQSANAGLIGVDNSLGCAVSDFILLSGRNGCSLTKIAGLAGTTQITVASAPTAQIGDVVACLGNWSENRFMVSNGNLMLSVNNGAEQEIVSGIVNIQAQYGVAALPNSSEIVQWVDASGGTWGDAMSNVDRNRIRAIRIAVVARSGLIQKEEVTQTCETQQGVVNNGPCAWDDANVAPAPKIDLSNDPDWKRYRYRVFESIIALRNVTWSVGAL